MFQKKGMNMTANDAKELLKAELVEKNLPYTKLTARRGRFADPAHASCIYVRIHGWEPHPAWDHLQQFAFQNGFSIET